MKHTFWQSIFTHFAFPDKAAKCNGVDPKLSAFVRSAPEYNNNLINSG